MFAYQYNKLWRVGIVALDNILWIYFVGTNNAEMLRVKRIRKETATFS